MIAPVPDLPGPNEPLPGSPEPGARAGGLPTFWDAAQIRRVSHQVADLVADYLTGLPDGPAYQPPPPRRLPAARSPAVVRTPFSRSSSPPG